MLPDELDVGRPGLVERLERAGETWFAAMRDGLVDSTESADLPAMLGSAGLEVVGSRLAREHLAAPLSDDGRLVALGDLRRGRQQFAELLDDEDLRTLDVLVDADDPRGVLRRSDVFLAASRQIVIARPISGR